VYGKVMLDPVSIIEEVPIVVVDVNFTSLLVSPVIDSEVPEVPELPLDPEVPDEPLSPEEPLEPEEPELPDVPEDPEPAPPVWSTHCVL
jgi:hypothetical protein